MAVEKADKPMEFVPFGNQDKIKLTVAIVKNLLCKPTRSGKLCSDKDALRFMMLCSARKLNPFEGDAFLVGYDGKDGIAEFNLITAEQAFLKRAELNPDYDGIESGVIVQNEDGSVEEIQGEFTLESQRCLGGWARLTVKNRKVPFYERLAVRQYAKTGPFWEKNPQHQIAKCARAAVLRRAFPTSLGGLYLQEETDNVPLKRADAFEVQPSKLVDVQNTAAQQIGNGGQDDSNPELIPAKTQGNGGRKVSPGVELINYLVDNGCTFDEFRQWGEATEQLKDASSLSSPEDITEADGRRLLRLKATILGSIQAAKQEQA